MGCLDTPEALVGQGAATLADVLLMDGGRAAESAWAPIRLVRTLWPELPVLILGDQQPRAILQSIEAGASGYWSGPLRREELEESIRGLAAGRSVLSPDALGSLVRNLQGSVSAQRQVLSSRERQVLALAGLGLLNKQIGPRLRVKDATVHTHLHRTFRKLGVRNKREALAKMPALRVSELSNSPESANGRRFASDPESAGDLVRRFSSDEACRGYLAGLRWPEGCRCPACGKRVTWESGRGLWCCRVCHGQFSVTADTVLDGTRLPFRTWFRMAWELAVPDRSGSALQLMRKCGLGSYKTAWSCFRKLRPCVEAGLRDVTDARMFSRGTLFRKALENAVRNTPSGSR